MLTFKRKLYSHIRFQKKYSVIGDIANTGVNTVKQVGGTGMQVVGDTVAGVGKTAQKAPGLLKRIGGAVVGNMLLPGIGGLIGFATGKKAVDAAGGLVKNVGDSISDAGQDLKSY